LKEKAILISVAALLVLAAPAFAQELGSQATSSSPVVEMFGLLGKGIASLPSDPLNFKIVKAGVARVKVEVNGTDTMVPIGILFLDDQKYRIKGVVIDNGSITGNIYLNDTQVGSLSVKSVMKGDLEVWAGTLTVDGTAYNLYILEAPRTIKRTELKEKIKEYCSETGDGNCTNRIEQFCENNPTDTRCLALFKAFCLRKNNMDDTRCREFMQGWCKDNPEVTDCRLYAVERSTKYCAEHGNASVCNAITKKLVDFCSTDPGNAKCNETCREHPEACKNVVKNLAEFCLENANNSACLQYCKNNPKACVKLAANLVSACINEPNKAECREYCKEHPAACKMVSAELATFCIGNQNNTRCIKYCTEHPDACRKVTERVESYCSANSNTPYCRGLCKKSLDKCQVTAAQPAQVEVENASAAATGA
jgi:hypothetical protein